MCFSVNTFTIRSGIWSDDSRNCASVTFPGVCNNGDTNASATSIFDELQVMADSPMGYC